MKEKTKLQDLEIYKLSMVLGDEVWSLVDKWNYFAKDTLGKQWTRAVDSVSANISEGYGRFSYVEMRYFVRIARGSLLEHITWLTKAKNRSLINDEIAEKLLFDSRKLSVKINNFLKSINNTINNTKPNNT